MIYYKPAEHGSGGCLKQLSNRHYLAVMAGLPFPYYKLAAGNSCLGFSQ